MSGPTNIYSSEKKKKLPKLVPFPTATYLDMGTTDFRFSAWIKEVTPCANVRILLGEKSFLVTKGKDETSPVKINGFLVSVEEYQQALAGEKVNLKNEDGDTVELKITEGTVMLDGDPITNVELSVKSAMPFVL